MPVYEKCKVFTCSYACNLHVIIDSVLFLIPQLYFQNQAAMSIYSEDLEPAYPPQKFYRMILFLFLILQTDTVRPRYQATLTSASFNSKQHSEVVW